MASAAGEPEGTDRTSKPSLTGVGKGSQGIRFPLRVIDSEIVRAWSVRRVRSFRFQHPGSKRHAEPKTCLRLKRPKEVMGIGSPGRLGRILLRNDGGIHSRDFAVLRLAGVFGLGDRIIDRLDFVRNELRPESRPQKEKRGRKQEPRYESSIHDDTRLASIPSSSFEERPQHGNNEYYSKSTSKRLEHGILFTENWLARISLEATEALCGRPSTIEAQEVFASFASSLGRISVGHRNPSPTPPRSSVGTTPPRIRKRGR